MLTVNAAEANAYEYKQGPAPISYLVITPQARAYEEYKRGQGLELSTLLTEHKAGLREKRARVRRLTLTWPQQHYPNPNTNTDLTPHLQPYP